MKKLLVIISILSFGLQYAIAQSGSVDQRISQNESKAQTVKVFPNPATNVVNILGLINSTKADILISDTYGNTVLQHRWAIKNNALNIPITSLTSGIYSISIRSKEQQVQTKFYKQ